MAAPTDTLEFEPHPPKRGWLGFPGTFWWANWMELVERFAYYGVRVGGLPVYMVLAYRAMAARS